MSDFCFLCPYIVSKQTENQDCKFQDMNIWSVFKPRVMGEMVTQPKKRYKDGQGTTPNFETSITRHFNNLYLDPSQFTNFDLEEGMIITENFGLARSFLIADSYPVYDPSCPCGTLWYYKLNLVQTQTPSYDTD
jgi:hypothetical protein